MVGVLLEDSRCSFGRLKLENAALKFLDTGLVEAQPSGQFEVLAVESSHFLLVLPLEGGKGFRKARNRISVACRWIGNSFPSIGKLNVPCFHSCFRVYFLPTG